MADALSRALGISPVLAQLLLHRGIRTPEEGKRFLDAGISCLHDPSLFKDMPKAVSLVRETLAAGGKVLVAGDYDVDGITSLAVLTHALLRLGTTPEYYLPHRVKDGYGLNHKVVTFAREKGVSLVITADCGTSNHEEIAQLKASGISVIVTDHHEPSLAGLPAADAIINPKLEGSGYPFRELAGVGVAFKLAQALCGDPLTDDLDLVALGTIADVVPLVDENRAIASLGLSVLSRTTRVGLRALMQSSRMGQKLSTTAVSYILGPRINASGRMDTADVALQLLMSRHPQEADILASAIEQFNRQRQKVEGRIMEEALAMIEREVDFRKEKVIVVAKEDWHHGVLGVVASKLADRFYRPTIVISKGEEGCKGSGRSIKNFHLFHALKECADTLREFGGHSHAVGLTVEKGNIAQFKERINRFAHETMTVEDLLPAIEADMELFLHQVTPELSREIGRLEPFGAGNPQPLFWCGGLSVKGTPQALARETLKFWATDGKVTLPVIGFGMANLRDSLAAAASVDLIYTPKIDSWQGDDSVILEAEEIIVR